MASLNTLRTKGAVIVTVIIFLALVAFLVQDIFMSGSSMLNSRKMRVGEIDGKNIGYVEFLNESDRIGNVYKMMWGREAVSVQEQETIYNTAWEQFLMKYSYRPSFEKMGLEVSPAEQVDMVSGVYISPVLAQTFMNPNTGMMDMQMMNAFLSSVNEDDYAYTIWNFLKAQMVDNRAMSKYLTLVSNGFYVTDFEVENAVKAANETRDALVASKSYFSVPDSLVNISDSRIRSYYNSHKESFRQGASRDVEYVVFDVMPSAADYEAADKEIRELAAEFGTSESPMQYATLNSQERPDSRYYKEEDLPVNLAGIAFGRNAGTMYGPVLSGDTYTVSRVSDWKMLPDSVGAKHILLAKTQTALADSLVRVVRSGSDFETLAREYSLDQSAAMNGGDLGRFAPEEMVPEFSNAVVNANSGDVISAESQFGLHVIQVTHKSRPVRKAQIATINYKVDPSAATMQDIYSRATNFITLASGTADGFKQAVTEEALSKRSIRIRNTDRSISGLENSRELIRWAYNSKKGAISGIMEIDGDYLVAALTDVKEEGYAPVAQVANDIREILRNEEKAKMIAAQISGNSIDAVAASLGSEPQEIKEVQFGTFFVPEIGAEPALIGAIAAGDQGQVSQPVKGLSGVYVFSISDVRNSDTANAESERARLAANAEYYIGERTMQAIYEESDVKDIRVKFF